ncbi:glycosyl hydrolase 115 family protein [Sphingomonas sp. CFBP 8760]|uniref:glycosyl hydrolase 115 family protein n=1 Tax=Sphingomonas sp. CFBP 8760 TaxID=2775282 RepID=UPI001785733B|nr:glycosyl hydrolase 115 family protein [Sphingomonas sp. CFBP 8760]MBD8548559.1 glycosyl hydrolase 115 family protein [Sphingomonas sp. CFBP 8760]
MRRLAFLAAALASMPAAAAAQSVTLFDGREVADIVHAADDSARLASQMLARDLTRVTGRTPRVLTDVAQCRRLCVIVGAADTALVRAVASDTGVALGELAGQWERYLRLETRSRSVPSRRYLLLAGSDRRGAVWGVTDLTREIGVSAWEWWADVTPRTVDRLTVNGTRRLSNAPSVRYRGIFLNDEDWGLQPWAAKTHEPAVGDIGPKTYARIFELLWRLKANLIWPAMHDSTKPFYQIPGNAEAARAHDIVVGTSHAEPMMRNNVREWDDKTDGEFNFFSNRAAMARYWRRRAEEVKGFENVYTIGLRGKHDSGMEGASTPGEARGAMADAIRLQRDILAAAQGRPAAAVPQVLTLYKEVLDIYATGLKVPDDVTIVWPEDNYGYINQLPNPMERARNGGSGVYYHISYWGRPHDYLWLATTHPALIREQLDRAWQTDARRLWVVNVGDIKPAEYLTQYFLDLAFDHRAFTDTPRAHLAAWARDQFGAGQADGIAAVMTEYYDLAFERRPEFMGFSQVEPVTPIRIGDHVRSGGEEARRRIDRYADLVARAEAIAAGLPADRRDAFFQIVLYPVRSAANINTRNLTLDLAALSARQGHANVNALADRARAAHAAIIADTLAYNEQNGGKWRHIMDMAPRRLPVFAEPLYPKVDLPAVPGCMVDSDDLVFVAGQPASHPATIRSTGQAADWSMGAIAGLTADASSGRLDAGNGFERRVMLRYDGKGPVGSATVRCEGSSYPVTPRLLPAATDGAPVTYQRIVSLAATDADGLLPTDWEPVPGLGSRGTALRSRLTLSSIKPDAARDPLRYSFTTGAEADADLRIVALPVHPLTSETRLRIGVRVDDGVMQILDYETHGRSEEWKRNVLSNSAVRSLRLATLAPGRHHLRLYALDPGFLLDRIDLRLEGAPDHYGAPLKQ